MDIIQGKQLADPLVGEPVQVDILLDIADSYRCYLTNLASSANGELSIQDHLWLDSWRRDSQHTQ